MEYLKDLRMFVILMLVVDLISFGIPIGSLFLTYVVFCKPIIFKQMVDELYN